jgi:hypothetical protein
LRLPASVLLAFTSNITCHAIASAKAANLEHQPNKRRVWKVMATGGIDIDQKDTGAD